MKQRAQRCIKRGHCSQLNLLKSPRPPTPPKFLDAHSMSTQTQRIVAGNAVRESDRQRGLCNSREEAPTGNRERDEAFGSLSAGYDEADHLLPLLFFTLKDQ